jgi:short-subunit dehydrogenase
MKQQTVLVTGASSGIGLELAKAFARQGYSLVLLARNQPALEQLADGLRSQYKVGAEVLVADLRQADAAAQVVQELARRNQRVDVLVNNAGFGVLGAFAQCDLQQPTDMMQVNMLALAQLTRLLLPAMLARNSGGVLNVASTAAFQAGPNMAVYYASKAFVLSFTEALHEEVAHTGLHVSCLCPGPTRTAFFAADNMEHARLLKFGAHSASAVAQLGLAAFQRNQAIAIPGLKNRLLAFSTRFAPRSVTRKMAQALNQ